MSRLRDKLERRNRLQKTPEPADAPPKSDKPSDEPSDEPSDKPSDEPSKLLDQLRQKMDRISTKRPKKNTAVSKRENDLAGEVIETETGRVLLVEKYFPRSYCHGRHRAADFLETGKHLGTLAQDPRLDSFDSTGAVFLDTETTGLAGGTGTLPFLIGVGWFEGDRFAVKQLFCREPSEEMSQLAILATYLSEATGLVTFNGKAFDLPLINTRFVLNRLQNPGANLPHLDLLHVARRVFKRRLNHCSLGNLESAVLGFERVDDIPGSEIPAAYRAYLRGGSADAMESVLSHNALDLVGLAALGAVLERMYRNPNLVEHAADHLGLAKTAIKRGDLETANAHLIRAGDSPSAKDSKDASIMAAKEAARRGEYESSIAHYQKALTVDPDNPAVHLALAKLYEHKSKEFASALHHAAHTAGAEGIDGAKHRIARLNRRKGKT